MEIGNDLSRQLVYIVKRVQTRTPIIGVDSDISRSCGRDKVRVNPNTVHSEPNRPVDSWVMDDKERGFRIEHGRKKRFTGIRMKRKDEERKSRLRGSGLCQLSQRPALYEIPSSVFHRIRLPWKHHCVLSFTETAIVWLSIPSSALGKSFLSSHQRV